MWQGKDHMEIRGIDHFGLTFIHPELLINSPAVWAVAVTAGIIVCFCVSARGTDANITAAFLGFTADDGVCRFPLTF